MLAPMGYGQSQDIILKWMTKNDSYDIYCIIQWKQGEVFKKVSF